MNSQDRWALVAEVRVHIPLPLRAFADGEATVSVEAGSVDSALAALRAAYPALAARLLADDGNVRPHVNLFLDGRSVRGLDPSELDIGAAAELTIVPSIAGGGT